jgi:hypothetical protein
MTTNLIFINKTGNFFLLIGSCKKWWQALSKENVEEKEVQKELWCVLLSHCITYLFIYAVYVN